MDNVAHGSSVIRLALLAIRVARKSLLTESATQIAAFTLSDKLGAKLAKSTDIRASQTGATFSFSVLTRLPALDSFFVNRDTDTFNAFCAPRALRAWCRAILAVSNPLEAFRVYIVPAFFPTKAALLTAPWYVLAASVTYRDCRRRFAACN